MGLRAGRGCKGRAPGVTARDGGAGVEDFFLQSLKNSHWHLEPPWWTGHPSLCAPLHLPCCPMFHPLQTDHTEEESRIQILDS